MFQPLPALKAMADETRLKILGILDGNSLSVNEIMHVLDMGQSRISRHLKILADAGLLQSRRDGSRIFYQFADFNGSMEIPMLLKSVGIENVSSKKQRKAAPNPLLLNDELEERLSSIIRQRSELTQAHFQKAEQVEEERQASWVDPDFYRKEILSLLPEKSGPLADVGCGSGSLAELLYERKKELILVDQSENMLNRAKVRMKNMEADFRLGSLEHLPMKNAEVNLIVLSMVLHHIPVFGEALLEANRVLKKGGSLIVAELSRHTHEEMRDQFADFYLGFDEKELLSAFKKSGFKLLKKTSGKGNGKIKCMLFHAEKTNETM